jgi:hypothetical protein
MSSWSITAEKDPVLPEDWYQAVVEDLEKIETQLYGERIMWKFYIPAKDSIVVGFCSLSASLKSKGAKWAKTILGIDAAKFNWGPDELKGKPCTVYIGVSEDKDGNERNIVEKVRPPRSSHGAEGRPNGDPGATDAEESFKDLPF